MAASGRRVVVHADDVGMCHGANRAFVELSHRGAITAGSVMVPCPWFAEVAAAAAEDPQLDLGVHLTLNSEHAGYRWGPVSRPPVSAGLTDGAGYLWPTVAELRRHAHPDAVEEEWRAQVDRALAAGIDVTHLDAHMGSALAPEWCDRYVALGVELGVPALITSTLAGYGPNNHLTGVDEDDFGRFVELAGDAGLPVFGQVLETDFDRPRGAPVDYAELLAGTDQDLVYCAFHPCRGGPGEVEVIEPDAHHVRVDEYELFRTDAWTDDLAGVDGELIGMRVLRDEYRARRPT
ncbi:MAG: ChbG/HpnK family deacetylase [Ilumatobacteraceae bacterium]